MDTLVLKNCLAISRLQSFTKVAAENHITQQALSKQIINLEAQLGFKLFDRTNRTIELTAAGAEFIREIEPALKMIDDAEEKARCFSRGQRGVLSVSYLGVFERNFLANAIERFNATYPDVAISANQSLYKKAVDDLNSKISDIILVPWFETEFADKIFGMKTFTMGYQCVFVGEKHPLANEKSLAAEQLLESTLIIQDFSDYPPAENAILNSVIRMFGGLPKKIIHTKDTTSMFLLVESGVGFALARSGLKRLYSNGKNIMIKEVDFCKKTPSKMSVVWRTDNANPVIQLFVNML